MKKIKAFLGFFVLVLGLFLLTPASKALAADSISYESPQYYEVNVDTVNLVPTISGDGYTFSISPALPNGLSLDTSTGVISGMPFVLSTERIYTITAVNSNGSQSFDLSLATLFTPLQISYDNYDEVRFFSINKAAIPNLIPDSSQEGIVYSISPDLPEGLFINPQNGVISGFPTEISSTTSYVVKAENPLGLSTTTVSITVFMPWNKVGGNVSDGNVSEPLLYSRTDDNDVHYIVYNATSSQEIIVSKYATSTKSWVPFGNPIKGAQGTDFKINLDSTKNPYISYNNGGQVFIRKYNSSNGNWESISSSYNQNNQETGSSISNSAISCSTVINSSNSTFVSYINNDGTLNISKLIESGGAYSEIDNMFEVVAPSNLSYRATSTYSTGYAIDDLIPLTVSGNPTRFSISPQLPYGIGIDRETGIISGTPLISTGEVTYTITASNSKGSTSAQLKITVNGPWQSIVNGLPMYAGLFSDEGLIKDDDGNFYLSYFSALTENSINGLKAVIYKYDAALGTWSNIFAGDNLIFDQENFNISMQTVDAIALKNNELYAMSSDFYVDFSNGEEEGMQNMIAKSFLKKYNATSSSWETLSESEIFYDPMAENMTKFKMYFVGEELFLSLYDSSGYIDVKKFNSADGSWTSVRDFTTVKVQYSTDKNPMAVDDNYLYVAYSDNTDGATKVGVHRLEVATGTWTDFYDDLTGLGIGLSSYSDALTFDSLEISNNGIPYFSYKYENCVIDEYNQTICTNHAVVKKIDGESLVLVSDEVNADSVRLSFDNTGDLWSSIGVSQGNYIRKYVDGAWVNFFNERSFSNNLNLELLFDNNNDLLIFSKDAYPNKLIFAKYEDVETTSNYDLSVPLEITYPKQTYTFVVGKAIETIYPTILGSVTQGIEFHCPEDDIYCFVNLTGLRRGSGGSILGTPLVATSSVIQMIARNSVSSSTFEIHINVIDPWVPLGEPLSSSAQSVGMVTNTNLGLNVAYSEYSSENSVNVIKASKYENESWISLGDYVSDVSDNAANPKMVEYQSDLYIAYSNSDSGELLVKKYNSQTNSWDQLGGKVNDGSYQNFSIMADYNTVMVMFHDTVNNRLVLKKYNDGSWDVKGSYIEGADYPTLVSSYYDNVVYASYISDSGPLIVEKYEEMNYSADGKDVPLDDIITLVDSGAMSPVGSVSATSTEAVKFNQRLNIIPFTGASITIPSGITMTASSTFSAAALIASSTVDLYHSGINNFTPAGTLMFGLPDLGLTLSSPITISIPTPSVSEGKQLEVYSKTAGEQWTKLTTCYVIAGKCSFQTSHLSEFAAGTVVVPSTGGGGGYVDPVKPACISVTYSDFSTICSGGFFTRSILTSSPASCTLSAAQIEATKQACTLLPIEEQPEPEAPAATSTATSTSATSTDNIIVKISKEVKEAFINAEKKLLQKINKLLTKRLLGRILLQVESHGEAWYLDPISSSRYYLADGDTAYTALRQFGLGIKDTDLAKIPVGTYSYKGDIDTDRDGLSDKIENGLGTNPSKADTDGDGIKDGDEVLKKNTNPLNKTKLSYSTSLINRLKGRIVIQTEKKGEAWYINPSDGKRYYLADGQMAYQVMRFLSLGITNNNIRQIMIGNLK